MNVSYTGFKYKGFDVLRPRTLRSYSVWKDGKMLVDYLGTIAEVKKWINENT